MKNTIFILFSFCLLTVLSCNTTESYQINGDLDNFEGYVFLRYDDKVDSTKVENGKFQFEGNVDRTLQATITNRADGMFTAPFYLDNEIINIKVSFNEPYIELISVESSSNALVESVLSDLEAIMEDEERLRNNGLFHYMDSLAFAYPRNDFVIELTTEVITSEFITTQQTDTLLSKIDTLLIDASDLKSVRTALDRKQRINVGSLFPDFNFVGLDNITYTEDSFPNQYLLVDIWATWCGPCIAGYQKLLPIYEELDGELEVLAISIDSSKERLDNFLSKNELPWKQVHVEGEWDNPFLRELGVVFLPFYYLITPESEIIAINPRIEDIPKLIKKHADL